MRRKVIGCILALLLLTAISGCRPDYHGGGTNLQSTASARQPNVQTNGADTKRTDFFRVGLSLQDDSPFVMRVCSKLEQLIERGDRNIELVVYNGSANATAQIAHVESFISSGFDVIILDPISYEDCALAVTIAQNAGIPLITTIAETYNPTGYISFVGSDHFESGVIEAKMVADYLRGSGKIVVLEGVMGISSQTERYNGYMSVFKDYPDIEIMAIQTAGWRRDESYAVVENWIRNGKDFSVVLSENDNMAMGAIEAIEELGKQKEIAVFGIDGDMDALTAVKEGRIKGTVFHNAQEIAQTLYDCIIRLKTYNTVEPVYLIPFEPVTQKNVDDYFIKY
jgi:ABC-type sugar transport system substrate-binding protein